MTDYILDGRYRLTERIAAGGMGEVWRGVDEMLGRPVAIKLLSSHHAGDEQFRARFRAEARYAAALSHNGIARVYDYGENSPLGGPYLVMELVDGEPLSAILEREGRLPADVTLDIISQAARALAVAHQAGIVHRDIKPGNLLITADGITKITDFGIAKAREAHDPHLTQTGIVMGTAMYVSPEQATGATVAGASDIYSLGIVAYECLAGQPPFVAEQPLAIAIMHKHDPVPPLPDDVPRPVVDLVLSMLAKDPADRPESALHVADRADVIRAAGLGNRSPGAPTTAADLSQFQGNVPTRTTAVPDFAPGGMRDFAPRGGMEGSPPAGGLQNAPTQAASAFYGSERTDGSPLDEPYPDDGYDGPHHGTDARRTQRRIIAGGAGVALLAIVAIVALMLSSSGNTSNHMTGLNSTAPSGKTTAPGKASKTPTPTPSASPSPTANVVTTTPAATTPPPVHPSKSVTTTKKATTPPPTTQPPTTQPPTTQPPTTQPPTTQPPTTQPPTTQPPTTQPPTTGPPSATTGTHT